MPDDVHIARLLSRALYTAIIELRPDYTPGAASLLADALAIELCGRTDLFTIHAKEPSHGR